jgi:hypothetical protein
MSICHMRASLTDIHMYAHVTGTLPSESKKKKASRSKSVRIGEIILSFLYSGNWSQDALFGWNTI